MGGRQQNDAAIWNLRYYQLAQREAFGCPCVLGKAKGAGVPTLIKPQAEFLQLKQKFRAYVGGYGSGKTRAGSTAICLGMWEHPKINQGYFAPTYPQIRDIFYPTIEEVSFDMGMKVKINQSNKEVHFYSSKAYRGTTICRSMLLPETIIGFKIGHALMDELDVLPIDKARMAWQKVIGRMRYNIPGVKNGVDVTTTPEGFRFVYDQFKVQPQKNKALREMIGMVHASTYDNEINLPDDYIPSMLATYPTQLIAAYLDGKFVNLTSGSVYKEFDRTLNNTDVIEREREPLHIGMDFNVGKMAGIVHVLRDDLPRATNELVGILDTPAMITAIKQRYPNHPVTIYPDASGESRKTNNASVSDLSLLRAAGFIVLNHATNPFIRDRVLSMNAMICLGGSRRYLVNVARCPTYTEALEKQIYDKNGEPDKTANYDHPVDAGGYFISHRYPIANAKAQKMQLVGF